MIGLLLGDLSNCSLSRTSLKSLQIEALKPGSMDMNVLGKGLIGMVTCDHCRKRNIQPPSFTVMSVKQEISIYVRHVITEGCIVITETVFCWK